MSPIIVDKEAKKDDIFSAAASVFAEKGYSGTRMEDIAVKANIGKGTVYEYFRSKDELFFALYQNLLDKFHTKIYSALTPQQSPTETLAAFVTTTLKAFDEWHEYAILLIEFWTEHRRGKFSQVEFSTIYDKSREIISGLIDAGIENGEFARVDSHVMASAIIGILDGVMLQRVFDPGLYKKFDMVDHIPRIIFDGLNKR